MEHDEYKTIPDRNYRRGKNKQDDDDDEEYTQEEEEKEEDGKPENKKIYFHFMVVAMKNDDNNLKKNDPYPCLLKILSLFVFFFLVDLNILFGIDQKC